MKKIFVLLLALAMAVAMIACTAAPEKAGSESAELKKFTVTVVHADGSEKSFDYETDAQLLGAYLEEQGLILSEGADDGMFHTVDAEKADWNVNQSYWAFYVGEDYAMAGIYDTTITDGAIYKLIYTVG